MPAPLRAAAAGPPAQVPLERAEQIFRRELELGCTDRLVQGGLEAFLRYSLQATASGEESDEYRTLIQQLSAGLSGYRKLSLSERRSRLERALGLIASVRRPEAASLIAATSPVSMGVGKIPREGGRATRAIEQYASDTPLQAVRGVGPSRAKALARLGLNHWGDLVHHYPNRHEDYPPPRRAVDLIFQRVASYEGIVGELHSSPVGRGLRRITAALSDATGQVSAAWLRAGFSGPKLVPGSRIAVSGNISVYGRQVTFDNPDWEPAASEPLHTRRLVPVYPLTRGIYAYWLRSLIRRALNDLAPSLVDHLPDWIRDVAGLARLGWAVEQAHFPSTWDALRAARRRLAFDELFLIQLQVQERRRQWQETPCVPVQVADQALDLLAASQPFDLTAAQLRAIAEIRADLGRTIPMSRLLQGEVGSGKTAVAAAALYVAVAAGQQGILMAPTEILAEQHYQTLTQFYDRAAPALVAAGYPVPAIALLTGSTRVKARRETLAALNDGRVNVLVGTHAVIEREVELPNLALCVVDEQHRFGVRQRLILRDKGLNPHLLVMTATPIPRTLALTLHGDLDLSLLDELPPGRQPIRTVLLLPLERAVAYEHIRREVQQGRQAFIICPLVEDSPRIEARAATEEFVRLQRDELAGLRLALLHGRMRPADKDSVMQRFRDAEFDVLVSTAVVEVGVDVPNATVMLIEGAERFGLAQLHQFRGRVGRGQHASTCILLSDLEAPDSIERLRVLEQTRSGLELAEFDLQTRGPGEFFGLRQSGLPELRVATLADIALVQETRTIAERLLSDDPRLERTEHAAIQARLRELQHQVAEPN